MIFTRYPAFRAFGTDAAGKRFVHEKTRNQDVSTIAMGIQLGDSD
jgi:hypothetical protein